MGTESPQLTGPRRQFSEHVSIIAQVSGFVCTLNTSGRRLQVSGVFQTYLVWDSILKENSWELWATILLGIAMVGTRVVAGLVRKNMTDTRANALRNVGWVVLVTQSLTMVSTSICAHF